MLQKLYIVVGLIAVALAIAGAFLPLLPTTPFALAALWCFSKSSPARHQRLLSNPILGPYLKNWLEGGGLSPSEKRRALIVLWGSLGLSWYLLPASPYVYLLLIPGALSSFYLLRQKTRQSPAALMVAPNTSPMPPTLLIAASIIENPQGQILLVRKQGSAYYMQAGGKLEPGESPRQALQRELAEELEIDPEISFDAHYLGFFQSQAANEPGFTVQAHVYFLALDVQAQARAELAEVRWAYPEDIEKLELAPLLRQQILPALLAFKQRKQGDSPRRPTNLA